MNPYTPATANQRIRILWKKFELSQAKDRAQLDSTIQQALEKAEVEWNKSPTNIRVSKIQRNATKVKIAKRIKAPYFDAARAKWHEMLEPLGLKPDYWTDLTEDEKRRITNTLGAEDESDEDVVGPEIPSPPVPAAPPVVQPPPPPPPQSHFFQPLAPSFSTSSRATNLSSSSYAFVNPSEFNSEEEDFEYEVPFSNPVATSFDLTSEDDDDPVASFPSYPGTRASLVGSAFSRASVSASTPSNTNTNNNNNAPPSARPLVSGFAYNAAPTGPVPTKRPQPQQPAPPAPTQPPPQVSQNEGKSTTTKTRIPRQPYVGPTLVDPPPTADDDDDEEPINEELEFEKFKMRTRITKIVEFHESAALAEISLSISMYKARKQSNNSKEEDAPRVLEHQRRMVQLQKEKEEERKAIVKSERARRQSEFAARRRRRSGSRSAATAAAAAALGGDDAKPPTANGGAFKTWDPSLSFHQEEFNIPSRFNLETLLSEDPAKQQTNVESLLNQMFADDDDDNSGPDGGSGSGSAAPHPHPGLFNGYSSSSSAFPNKDAFRGSFYNQQEQLRHQTHSSTGMSWNNNKTRTNSSPQRKTHLSPFGESSDDDDDDDDEEGGGGGGGGTPASVKPSAATSAWPNSTATPVVNGGWKKTAAPTQLRQGGGSNNNNNNILSSSTNPNLSFAAMDEMEEQQPEPTATPFMMNNNSKAAKGKKIATTTTSVLAASEKSSPSPPTADMATAASNNLKKAPAVLAETPAAAVPPTPALAPAPAGGKKQTKKQRQAANKKGGGAPAATAATPTTLAANAAAAIPEQQEPETESVLPHHQHQQRVSPQLETPVVVAAPNPITPHHQTSEHASWLPPKSAAMARARMVVDSEPQPQPPPTPSSFSWDEITSTPRPASKIPAHILLHQQQQESLKMEGTLRPSSLLLNNKGKKGLMAEIFSATSSRTTLEQMPPTTPATPIAKGPVWGSSSTSTTASANSALSSTIPTSVTPGPSLWGKTRADFEAVKAVQQPVAVAVGGDSWVVPGGFDGVDDYKNEGDGGGGGGGNEGGGLWGSITSSLSKQNGKATTTIPAKQSIAGQRLRRVSEATATASSSSSPAAAAASRGFGTSDIGKQQQQLPAKAAAAAAPPTTVNSKKAQGKKNGKGKQRATIEVVSDEEKDNIDILPKDSSYIMEPKVILEPKPSVPSFVYNPIIDFGAAAAAAGGGGADDDDAINDIAYLASTFKPSSSSQDDDFFNSGESGFSSNPFKTSTMGDWGGGGGGGMMGGGVGGGVGGVGKHARWTPAVTNFLNDEENSSFSVPVAPSRLQQQAGVQQTPIWGQPNLSGEDDSGVSSFATVPPPPSRLQKQTKSSGVQQTPIWGQPNLSGEDDSGVSSFQTVPPPSRLRQQTKSSSVQQKPVWGQPNLSGEDDSGVSSFQTVPPPPSRLQQQTKSSSVQQTPVWGQPNPSAKDKGKGKKK